MNLTNKQFTNVCVMIQIISNFNILLSQTVFVDLVLFPILTSYRASIFAIFDRLRFHLRIIASSTEIIHLFLISFPKYQQVRIPAGYRQ